ncbi:MAG: glycosyl hydrolase, partial [Eudoraea sp.]
SSGEVVKVVEGTNKKGYNRVNWPLDMADRSGEDLEASEEEEDDWDDNYIMATPGNYSVQLWKMVDGQLSALADEQSFKVVPLAEGALKGASYDDIVAFRKSFELFQQDLKATNDVLQKSQLQINAMQRALLKSSAPSAALAQKLYEAKKLLQGLDSDLNGNKAKGEIGERNAPNPSTGRSVANNALTSSTYGPTANHKAALETAQKQLASLKSKLSGFVNSELPSLEAELKAAGAPWIEGQGLLKQ